MSTVSAGRSFTDEPRPLAARHGRCGHRHTCVPWLGPPSGHMQRSGSEVDMPATSAYEPKRERVCTYVLRWRSNVTIMYHYVPRCNSTMQFLSSRVSLWARGGRAWTGPAARSGASTSDGPVSHWCRRVGLVWRGRCVTSMASRREITRLSEEQ